jgi:signal transduction histidine kinase
MISRLPVCAERSVSLEHADGLPLIVHGHRAQLTQVFVNLLTNALEATEPGVGRVRITMRSQSNAALVRVEDNGCGMTQDTIEHAFDPLFTDKPNRGLAGCGLGLSVSHGIIERHGGRIDAASDGLGRGSTFIVEIPAATALATAEVGQ